MSRADSSEEMNLYLDDLFGFSFAQCENKTIFFCLFSGFIVSCFSRHSFSVALESGLEFTL